MAMTNKLNEQSAPALSQEAIPEAFKVLRNSYKLEELENDLWELVVYGLTSDEEYHTGQERSSLIAMYERLRDACREIFRLQGNA